MPDKSRFKMDFRPRSYGFERVDRPMAVFDRIKDRKVRKAVHEVLVDEGADGDIEGVLEEYSLDPRVITGLERLMGFGERERGVPVGAVKIVEIDAASTYAFTTCPTFIYARRTRQGGITYLSKCFDDDPVKSGRSDQPLTFREMIKLVDKHLALHAPFGCRSRGDWRDGYFADITHEVYVESKFYPELSR